MGTPTPPLESPLTPEDIDLLVQYHQSGCRPVGTSRLFGVERELLPADPKTGVALHYDEKNGVHDILKKLTQAGWVASSDPILSLKKNDETINLEPGGQIEVSGAPKETVVEAITVLIESTRDVCQAANAVDRTCLGLGMQPLSVPDDIPFIPKDRYDIMDSHFTAMGGPLYDWMMKVTASIQVNMDYRDEENAADMFRTGMALTPLTTAMFANSPLTGGKPNGHQSRRHEVWWQTDNDRCGLIPAAFEQPFGFREYAEWALDVPMMFLMRDGVMIPMKGLRFRDFLVSGYEGKPATLGDYEFHLTGIFTEVRLKTWVEVRNTDTQVKGMAGAIPAFWAGILYDKAARDRAWNAVAGLSFEQRVGLCRQAAIKGYDTPVPTGGTVLDVSREVVAAARDGLERVESGALPYLEPLEEAVAEGRTPADTVMDAFQEGGLPAVLNQMSVCQKSPI